MGANASREVSIGEGETKASLPRSSTLPAGLKGLGGKFNFSGTLPRGLGLDSSFSVKLTKSKKIDGSPSKKDLDETKVEIVAKEKSEEEKAENEETENSEKQEEVEEETLAVFIESLLSKVVEDTIEKSRKMKKSSTLPATFRGLGNLNRSQSFGKRIRQSFRRLVNVKKPLVEKSEENMAEDITEEEKEVEVEKIEENEAKDSGVGDESKMTEEKTSVFVPLKKLDFQAKKKQLQASLKAMVERKRKPKKESLELINSIIEEIINEVEVEEEEKTGDKAMEEMLSKRDEELFARAATSAADKEEDSVGVLDKSND